jgi:hypothetical protein
MLSWINNEVLTWKAVIRLKAIISIRLNNRLEERTHNVWGKDSNARVTW